MLNRSGVYEIVNSANGKRYIGSAKRFRGRFAVHLSGLRNGKHSNRRLQRAWNKYGEDAFLFRPLLACAPNDLIFFEQRAIDAYRPEYNLAPTAGNCLGVKHSAETRAKRSALNAGNKFCVGRKISEATRLAVIESNRRRKGFKRRPESVAATAAAHRGMKRSAETRAKIAAKAKGRKRSVESIQKAIETCRRRKAEKQNSTNPPIGGFFIEG